MAYCITTTLRKKPLPDSAVRASNCCFKYPVETHPAGNLFQLEGRFLLDLSPTGNSLRGDVGERSIAARLAMYLQNGFPKYKVDADYNRAGDVPKRLNLLVECAGYRNEDNQSLAVPDAIVHRRGSLGPNLLVLELKKTTKPDKGHCDRVRLRAFRKQIGYCYGALIVCETRKGREPDIIIAEWLEG
jgi:hypothetical protein